MLRGVRPLSVFFALVLVTLGSSACEASDRKVVIASGGQTGVYYPVAIAICRLFNARYAFHGFGCQVDSTEGSIDNLHRLRTGEANFAVVQSDWLLHAFKGTGIFEKPGEHAELRAILPLYSEAFTVLARRSAGIENLNDLLGRRVNIGNPGSGQRATMEVLMRVLGWTRFDFAFTREFGPDYQAQALCDGEVDAIVFVAGHPSGSIKSATQLCDTNFVEITGKQIEQFLADNPSYIPTKIPTAVYFNNEEEISTFGLTATLVTNASTPDDLVSRVLTVIVEDADRLTKLHPALSGFDPRPMLEAEMPAPRHPAAVAFLDRNVN
jgi:TRAP transporter TAXI family solute receptor